MRILMLGNSLTTANHMPDMLAELLTAEVRVHARGGARLAEHLNPKTRNGALTQAALANEAWDFVVMQEMSHGPATSPTAYARSVASLSEAAKAAGAQPVIYGTWPYRAGCAKLVKLGMSHDDMSLRMAEAFAQAAADSGALLADVAAPFRAGSADELYAADGVHPSPAGSRLAALVLAETMGKGIRPW
ncbi:Uncharacterised protein [Slackia heliotrinireducens]|uniref:SGNH hydrolase-type esterase domain-containing protein n=2 Tax=Slackia heliotrinireducens (strain ATCC 29202 / DSM 20476 / NCTC 11029 / RHS 1) TaxID=471855 RepID=C7N6X3_SLAHD|nr:SGNH/GDSL hydrolase family protein [Slackia heliotrinireducens]ACV22658.1 hypothetical protein Shel_16390 [Slackia heliotrinireducens DSM 20476]VEH01224.1 Uncharacterised protein [Slackia heliotrinireducens]